MYSYVKFKAFSFFFQKIIEIHKKGPGGFIGVLALNSRKMNR
jgi:hypothetical protein